MHYRTLTTEVQQLQHKIYILITSSFPQKSFDIIYTQATTKRQTFLDRLHLLSQYLSSIMSRASKLTLAGTSLFAVGTVFFVHFQQQSEKAAMHAGVVRDMEQQRLKKERREDFELQQALEKQYRQVQTVHDGAEEPPSPAR